MKIKIDDRKLSKAVEKLHGIQILVENKEDAKEALDLILQGIGLPEQEAYAGLQDIKLGAVQSYETSAVEYKTTFLLEFVFDQKVEPAARVALVKELQEFFLKV